MAAGLTVTLSVEPADGSIVQWNVKALSMLASFGLIVVIGVTAIAVPHLRRFVLAVLTI